MSYKLLNGKEVYTTEETEAEVTRIAGIAAEEKLAEVLPDAVSEEIREQTYTKEQIDQHISEVAVPIVEQVTPGIVEDYVKDAFYTKTVTDKTFAPIDSPVLEGKPTTGYPGQFECWQFKGNYVDSRLLTISLPSDAVQKSTRVLGSIAVIEVNSSESYYTKSDGNWYAVKQLSSTGIINGDQVTDEYLIATLEAIQPGTVYLFEFELSAADQQIANKKYVDDASTSDKQYTDDKVSSEHNYANNTYAPKASPTLTGTPTTVDISVGDSDSKIANKKYVDNKVSTEHEYSVNTYAPKASPTLTGTPSTPNITSTSASSQIANKKYVDDTSAADRQYTDTVSAADRNVSDNKYATKNEPHFTGEAIFDDDVAVHGDMYVEGKTVTTHETQVNSSADFVVVRDDKAAGLGVAQYAGLAVNNYAANKLATVAVDKDGVWRVADSATETTHTFTNISMYDDTYYNGLTQSMEIEGPADILVNVDADELAECVYYNGSYYHYNIANSTWHQVSLVNNAMSTGSAVTDPDVITALVALTKTDLVYYRSVTDATIDASQNQPLLTRAEAGDFEDNDILSWDAAATKAKNITRPTMNNTYLRAKITQPSSTLVYTDGNTLFDKDGNTVATPAGTPGTPVAIGKFISNGTITLYSADGSSFIDSEFGSITPDLTPAVGSHTYQLVQYNDNWYGKIGTDYYEVPSIDGEWTVVTDAELLAILEAETFVTYTDYVETYSLIGTTDDTTWYVYDDFATATATEVTNITPDIAIATTVSTVIYSVAYNLAYDWASGGGNGVAFIGTRAQYEVAKLIAEGQDGYIPGGSMVIITDENDNVFGQEV